MAEDEKDVKDQTEDSSTEAEETSEQEESKAIPYDRFKKVNDEKKELEERLAKYESKEESTKDSEHKQTKPSSADERYERLELKVDGYNDEEIDFIMRNGGKAAKDDPFVQRAIDSIREERTSENAAEGAADVSGKSDIERKYTNEQLKNMSTEELEKILPKA